jgi:putative (di)nucleoside polyphosphate hydrolase
MSVEPTTNPRQAIQAASTIKMVKRRLLDGREGTAHCPSKLCALFGRVPPGKTSDMGDWIDAEGFRANVGIVLMRDGGEVFLGQRTGGRGWQFPQGGVRQGESIEQALYRELQEEIGLTRRHVTLAASTADWIRYRLPKRYLRRGRGPTCIGQKQRWFLLRLAVPESEAEFDFKQTAEPEFDGWRWANYWEPVREVIYFKRPVYVRMLTELAPTAFPDGAPALPAWWQAEIQAAAEA